MCGHLRPGEADCGPQHLWVPTLLCSTQGLVSSVSPEPGLDTQLLAPQVPPQRHPYQRQQHHRAPPQAVGDGARERCPEELQG